MNMERVREGRRIDPDETEKQRMQTVNFEGS